MSPLRLSELYAPTLKETPAEAELASHRLLLRAGFIRKTAAGIYSLLPLAWCVVRKIEQIIREEMAAVGAQEMRLPIMQPEELWRESKRWDAYGPELMRLADRHGRGFCLGPTHEEIITALVAAELRSYRDLPVCLYQMNTKFRDEVRPRFGLLRGREFLMKDAYSFHPDQASLSEYYERQAAAYGRICERMGLSWRRVEADPGQIGGKVTAEFMALADAGESDIVYCSCGFAADVEVFEDAEAEAEGATVVDGASGTDAAIATADAPVEPPRACPTCGAPLERARGIEIGQVFQVGPQYSEALGAYFADEAGAEHPLIMGCYGWGVSRSLAAAVEQHHDEQGIIWPTALAPAEVVIIAIGDSAEVGECVQKVAEDLARAGLAVALDDRSERPGVKFADADLIGWPYQVVIGARGLAQGSAEVKQRASGDKQEISLAELTAYLKTDILVPTV